MCDQLNSLLCAGFGYLSETALSQSGKLSLFLGKLQRPPLFGFRGRILKATFDQSGEFSEGRIT